MVVGQAHNFEKRNKMTPLRTKKQQHKKPNEVLDSKKKTLNSHLDKISRHNTNLSWVYGYLF